MSQVEPDIVRCAGGPREMGRQYGRAARDAIARNVDFWIGEGRLRASGGFAAAARAVLARRLPEVLDELEGLADGSGAPLEALLMMNQVDTFAAAGDGCTSLAVADGPDGPVLGKNNDGERDGRAFVVRVSVPDDGLAMVQVTYAGWLSGLDAMNAAGLANGHNSVGSVFEKSGRRVDVRLWAYRLMRRCRSTGEFLAGLERAPLTGKGFNIVLADAAGDTCVVEAAVPRVACRGRGERFVFATNHYVSAGLADADRRRPAAKEISRNRYDYLRRIERRRPPAGREDVRDLLRSHEPWAPCRHGGPHVSFTLWSMIALPARRRLLVAPGPPCERAHRALDLDAP